MKDILVLCLGNEILSDDAFGPVVRERLLDRYDFGPSVEIIFAPLAGFALLDLLQGRRRVLIVDSIITDDARPGRLRYFEMGDFTPSRNLTISHQISLPTALELGRRLGYDLPSRIDVLAVEVDDVYTLSEQMTPAVAAAVDGAVLRAYEWILSHGRQPDDVFGKNQIAGKGQRAEAVP